MQSMWLSPFFMTGSSRSVYVYVLVTRILGMQSTISFMVDWIYEWILLRFLNLLELTWS